MKPSDHQAPAHLSSTDAWRREVIERVAAGQRLVGLFASGGPVAFVLTALVTTDDAITTVRASLAGVEDGQPSYASLTPDLPAAFWYERAMHDLSGVVPHGHPRLDPLLLPRGDDVSPPLPGADTRTRPADSSSPAVPSDAQGPPDVTGRGVFSLPFGPVRSGVFESLELLLETPGEDIPYLTIRPHHKHRGIAKQFEGRSARDALLVAERVEGISSVAHALAFAHAMERLGGLEVPEQAGWVRVLHAELERLANHLDVTMRVADAAGLAVAASRFGWHKERVLRWVSSLCGSRFGRGVVRVGGAASIHLTTDLAGEVAAMHRAVSADIAALTSSPSFLDRLRGTGPLAPELARRHGALGPIGRASGYDDDARRHRPYDAYQGLETMSPSTPAGTTTGDALARVRVRWHEIDTSTTMVIEALDRLRGQTATTATPAVDALPDGLAVGWAEAAQGEVVHCVEILDGIVTRCFARSASLHNLVLLHDVFDGDIFTDLPFIEASFGLGYAGVSM